MTLIAKAKAALVALGVLLLAALGVYAKGRAAGKQAAETAQAKQEQQAQAQKQAQLEQVREAVREVEAKADEALHAEALNKWVRK